MFLLLSDIHSKRMNASHLQLYRLWYLAYFLIPNEINYRLHHWSEQIVLLLFSRSWNTKMIWNSIGKGDMATTSTANRAVFSFMTSSGGLTRHRMTTGRQFQQRRLTFFLFFPQKFLKINIIRSKLAPYPTSPFSLYMYHDYDIIQCVSPFVYWQDWLVAFTRLCYVAMSCTTGQTS